MTTWADLYDIPAAHELDALNAEWFAARTELNRLAHYSEILTTAELEREHALHKRLKAIDVARDRCVEAIDRHRASLIDWTPVPPSEFGDHIVNMAVDDARHPEWRHHD